VIVGPYFIGGLIIMKAIIITVLFCLFSFPSFADENLIGVWKDKSEPQSYIYEFKEGNDFIFTQKWDNNQ
jgi:hypothetical protein